MAHNHSNGKNHKKKKPVKKGKMKPQKLFKEPCTPGKKAKEEPHGQMRPCSGESRTTPSNMIVTSTPSTPFKTPNSVASRVKAVGSAIAKKMTPSSRKTETLIHSPSPSPLRWVTFPVKRGHNIKGGRLFTDDRPPVIIPATPPRTITASTAPDAAPSTKLHNLSDSDSVYIGSPPMAASLDKTPKSSAAGTGDVDQHELITTLPQAPETSSDLKDAKRRGPAAFMRQAGGNVVSGGACIKRGVKAGAVKIWAGIRRQAQCACFVRGTTKE